MATDGRQYLVVGKEHDRDWMAWLGTSLDGWGLFVHGRSFRTFQEAEHRLSDARKDAKRENLSFGKMVYVAFVEKDATRYMTVFCPSGLTVRVDFTDNDLTSGQADMLGVL